MDDKEMIHISTLKFEIKPYYKFNWVVNMMPISYHYIWGLFRRDL